jgi:hypothetical protein
LGFQNLEPIDQPFAIWHHRASETTQNQQQFQIKLTPFLIKKKVAAIRRSTNQDQSTDDPCLKLKLVSNAMHKVFCKTSLLCVPLTTSGTNGQKRSDNLLKQRRNFVGSLIHSFVYWKEGLKS